MGVSGGKDNLCLLHALVAYRRRAPLPYELTAATIGQGKFKAPIRRSSHASAREDPWVLRDDRPLRPMSEGIANGCDVAVAAARCTAWRPRPA